MSPESMSSNYQSDCGENLEGNNYSNIEENDCGPETSQGNYIKIKIDGFPETCKIIILHIASKRNIIQKKRADYDEYLDQSSSNKSKKKKSSIGK